MYLTHLLLFLSIFICDYRAKNKVEQSKDAYSWSTSSFPTIIYLGTIIFFLSFFIIYSFFHCPHIFIFIFTVRTGYLYDIYIIKVALSVCLSVCIPLAPTVLVQSA